MLMKFNNFTVLLILVYRKVRYFCCNTRDNFRLMNLVDFGANNLLRFCVPRHVSLLLLHRIISFLFQINFL